MGQRRPRGLHGDELAAARDDIPYTFLKGGDATQISHVEQTSTQRFFDQGLPVDPFVLLKNRGFDIARLRLYNDPGNASFTPSCLMPPTTSSILPAEPRNRAS